MDDLDSIFDITKEIERISEELNVSYIDACVHYAEQANVDIEFLGDIIKKNQNMMFEIQKEAEDLHFLKKEENKVL